MSKLKKLYKGSKPSKIIKVFTKGDVWESDIYVRPFPRTRMKEWMSELENSEKNAGAQVISRIFELMAQFAGECMCDKSGVHIADGSQETIDFLLDIDDDQILLDLYKEASRASGLISVADGLIELFSNFELGEATKQPAKKNRQQRRINK